MNIQRQAETINKVVESTKYDTHNFTATLDSKRCAACGHTRGMYCTRSATPQRTARSARSTMQETFTLMSSRLARRTTTTTRMIPDRGTFDGDNRNSART
jgi:hypothetical protein